MLDTRWDDWAGTVSASLTALAARVERIVLVGQSMGATLVLDAALSAAFGEAELSGVVCINPLTQIRDSDTMAMLDDFLDDGVVIAPGGPSDIADPDGHDIAYSATPLAPLRSLMYDGVVPITDRFGELTVPLRLFTSRNDHVVPPSDSEHLAAAYGGPVSHTWLERSFHVASRDLERELVIAGVVEFVEVVAT
jgi:carboxylesterase